MNGPARAVLNCPHLRNSGTHRPWGRALFAGPNSSVRPRRRRKYVFRLDKVERCDEGACAPPFCWPNAPLPVEIRRERRRKAAIFRAPAGQGDKTATSRLAKRSQILEKGGTERWPSGRRRSPAKGVYRRRYRGFESLPLRHSPIALYKSLSPPITALQLRGADSRRFSAPDIPSKPTMAAIAPMSVVSEAGQSPRGRTLNP